jgi:hypothetical protein
LVNLYRYSEAREEWMRNVYDDVNVSRLHADVAAVLTDLGGGRTR